MPNNVTIEVTQEDIDRGIRESCTCCPIANAMKRILKPDDVRVRNKETWTSYRYVELTHLLPNEAAKFIRYFDNGETVHPFTFELEEVSCTPSSK